MYDKHEDEGRDASSFADIVVKRDGVVALKVSEITYAA